MFRLNKVPQHQFLSEWDFIWNPLIFHWKDKNLRYLISDAWKWSVVKTKDALSWVDLSFIHHDIINEINIWRLHLFTYTNTPITVNQLQERDYIQQSSLEDYCNSLWYDISILETLEDTQYKSSQIFSVTSTGHNRIIGVWGKTWKKTPPRTSTKNELIPEYTS